MASNKCHNCGLSHLPQSCKQPLVRCYMCQAHGHMAMFCPAGILTQQSDFHYVEICHNCGLAHLPEPCTVQVWHCSVCHNYGHLEVWCPVEPAVIGPGSSEPYNDQQVRNIRVRICRQLLDHLQINDSRRSHILNVIRSHETVTERQQLLQEAQDSMTNAQSQQTGYMASVHTYLQASQPSPTLPPPRGLAAPQIGLISTGLRPFVRGGFDSSVPRLFPHAATISNPSELRAMLPPVPPYAQELPSSAFPTSINDNVTDFLQTPHMPPGGGIASLADSAIVQAILSQTAGDIAQTSHFSNHTGVQSVDSGYNHQDDFEMQPIASSTPKIGNQEIVDSAGEGSAAEETDGTQAGGKKKALGKNAAAKTKANAKTKKPAAEVEETNVAPEAATQSNATAVLQASTVEQTIDQPEMQEDSSVLSDWTEPQIVVQQEDNSMADVGVQPESVLTQQDLTAQPRLTVQPETAIEMEGVYQPELSTHAETVVQPDRQPDLTSEPQTATQTEIIAEPETIVQADDIDHPETDIDAETALPEDTVPPSGVQPARGGARRGGARRGGARRGGARRGGRAGRATAARGGSRGGSRKSTATAAPAQQKITRSQAGGNTDAK